MSMMAAVALLDGVPDLFVKLPKRDGLTRYRLNSRPRPQRRRKTSRPSSCARARREGWVFYASASMVLLAVLIVVLLMGWR